MMIPCRRLSICSRYIFVLLLQMVWLCSALADTKVNVSEHSRNYVNEYLRMERFQTGVYGSIESPPSPPAEMGAAAPTWKWTTTEFSFENDTQPEHALLQSPEPNNIQTLMT